MQIQFKVKRNISSSHSLITALNRPSVLVVLSLLPFGVLLFFVARYTINMPLWDQWQFIPMLEKSYQGTLSLSDLWAQHNEHRLFFPRLIMVILAQLSNWNIYWELALNVVLAVGIFAVFVYQTSITAKTLTHNHLNWLIPILSLYLFSFDQWENWTWGWQIQIFLNVLTVVAGIVLLAHPSLSRWRFICALVLGVVAIYSFANGICYWFIGLAVIFVISDASHRALRNRRMVIWSIVGALTIFSYLYDYQKPSYHPSLWIILERPFDYVTYVLMYLGAPIISIDNPITGVAGLFGILLNIYLVRSLIRDYGVTIRSLLPYLAMSLYAVGSALITGVGRAGFGSWQAVASRYITISGLLWVTNIVFIYLLLSRKREDAGVRVSQKRYRQHIYGFAILLALLILVIDYSSFKGSRSMYWKYGYMEPVRAALLAGRDLSPELKGRLFDDPKTVDTGLAILKKYHLSLYSDTQHQ